MQKLRQDLTIGKNLKELRKKARLSQDDVAAQLQILGCTTTRSTYSKMETGGYSIRVSELIALRKVFKCRFDHFFNGLED